MSDEFSRKSKQIFLVAMEDLQQRIRFRTAAMFLFSKDGALVREGIANCEDNWFPEESYQVGESIVGRTVRPAHTSSNYGKVQNCADVSKDFPAEHLRRYNERFPGIRTAVSIPLNGPNQTFGAIRIVDKLDEESKPTHLSTQDFVTFSELVSRIALAIVSEKRRQESESILAIGRLLTSNDFDVQRIYQRVTETLVNPWTDYVASVLRVANVRDELELASIGQDRTHIVFDRKDRTPRHRTEGIVGMVYVTGVHKILSIPDNLAEFKDQEWLQRNKLKTFGCFPIKSENRPIGTVSVYTKYPYKFYDGQIRLIWNYCEQLATAHGVTRLLRTRDEIAKFVQHLSSPQEGPQGGLDVEAVLQALVDRAKELTRADVGHILLTTKRDNHLHYRKWTSDLRREHLPPAIDIDGRGISAAVVRLNETINCPDVTNEPRFVDLLGEWSNKIKSELAVPMRYEGQVIGVLNMESMSVGRFSKDDEFFLETLANQATVVYQRQRFYEAATRLANLTFPLTDRKSIYRNFVQAAAKICDVDFVLLFLLDQEQPGSLRLYDFQPSTTRFPDRKPPTMPEGEGRSWKALKSHSLQIYENIGNDSHFYYPEFAKHNSLQTMLAIPLFLRDRRAPGGIRDIGVIDIFTNRHCHFFRAEKHLLSALAISAAFAIDGARMLEQIQTLNDRTSQFERRIMFAEVATEIIHHTKNIKNIINTAFARLTDELSAEYGPSANNVATEILETIAANLSRQDDYYHGLTRYTKRPEPTFEYCDLNNIVRDVLLFLDGRIRRMQVHVHQSLTAIPEIQCDKDQILQALTNVLMNALDAMPGGGELEITTELSGQGEWVRVRVRDTGEGIEDAVKKRVFEPLFTTKGFGTGVGLSIAHRIIAELHGGGITFESERGVGTTFMIDLRTEGEGRSTMS